MLDDLAVRGRCTGAGLRPGHPGRASGSRRRTSPPAPSGSPRHDPRAVPHLPAAGLRDDGLRRDERARRGHRLGQPRPGLPRLPRAAGGARRRPGRHRHRRRPVPARPRAARSCARRSPTHVQRVPRPRPTTPTTRSWSPPARPRRSAAALLALLDTGDEVVLFEPMYDCYAGGHRDGRRRRPAGAAAPTGRRHRAVDVRPRRAPRGDHPADDDPAAQHPAQPDRQGLHATRSCRFLAELAIDARPARPHRRGLRAPGLQRAREHRSIAALPGHARAHARGQQRRQDLQRHRLEDRLDLRARPAGRPPSAPPSSS